MGIGIIGSGHIGRILARRLAALGHEVRIANSRGPESLAALAAETGATASTVEHISPRRSIFEPFMVTHQRRRPRGAEDRQAVDAASPAASISPASV